MESEFRPNIITPILLIVVFALIIGSAFLPADFIGSPENNRIAPVLLQIVTFALPSVFYCIVRGREFGKRLRIRLPRLNTVLYTVYYAVFLICLTALCAIMCSSLWPDLYGGIKVTEYQALVSGSGFTDTLYIIVTFCILPAVTEEFLFRGIVLAEYERNGVIIAIIVSSLVFSMSHFSFPRFPVYFFPGIVLALVTYTTRSVLPAMLLHALSNGIVLYGEKYVLRIVKMSNVSLTLLIFILGTLLMLSGLLAANSARNIYKTMAEENVESEYTKRKKKSVFIRLAESVFSPAFLVLVIGFVAYSIISIRR